MTLSSSHSEGRERRGSVLDVYRRHFMLIELLIPTILVGIAVYLVERNDWGLYIHNVLGDVRTPLYTSIAAIAGAILGFTLTGLSILLAFFESSKLSVVRQSRHYVTVYRIYISTIRWLALVLAAAILATVLDKQDNPTDWVIYLVTWSVSIGTWRVARCVWVLERIIDIVTQPAVEE